MLSKKELDTCNKIGVMPWMTKACQYQNTSQLLAALSVSTKPSTEKRDEHQDGTTGSKGVKI